MANYYFTFGSAEHFPFGRNDFVLVRAADIHDACSTFRAEYPDFSACILNCADYYSEEEFNEFRDKYYAGVCPARTLESDRYRNAIFEKFAEGDDPELE